MTAPGTRRAILHVDMDAFFASVELRRRPDLRGHPVVVGGRGDPTRRGVVSTATYEARQYGIHSGMALRTAARLCPDALFLPVDFSAYREASRAVFAELARINPDYEPVGLDEAYLDVSNQPGDTLRLARSLKHAIRERTALVASIGIGPNRLLAKIASDLEKPDGLTRLALTDVPTRVWPLDVRVIHGVGPRTAERLNRLGIATVGDLARSAPEPLLATFSPGSAVRLKEAAHGHDDSPVRRRRERKSVGRERTFETDCRSSGRLAFDLGHMLETVVESLRRHRLLARTVTVKVRYRDFVTNTRSLSLAQPTDHLEPLLDAARACLFQHRLHRAVRLLGVQLSQLSAGPPPAGAASTRGAGIDPGRCRHRA